MATFIPDPSFLKLLAESEDLKDVTDARAEEVAAVVREIGPQRSGHYVDNIYVEDIDETGRHGSRVVADDPTGAAGLIEFGTEDTPAFAPLRRALEQVFGMGAIAADE